jgi:periplasmic protein CpxP/Spy
MSNPAQTAPDKEMTFSSFAEFYPYYLIIATTLALSTVLSGAVLADTSTSQHHQRYLDRLSEQLDLTPEQKREVSELHAEQYEKRKALRDETRNRMDEILTAEQRQKLDTIHQQRVERMKQHHGKHQRNEP